LRPDATRLVEMLQEAMDGPGTDSTVSTPREKTNTETQPLVEAVANVMMLLHKDTLAAVDAAAARIDRTETTLAPAIKTAVQQGTAAFAGRLRGLESELEGATRRLERLDDKMSRDRTAGDEAVRVKLAELQKQVQQQSEDDRRSMQARMRKLEAHLEQPSDNAVELSVEKALQRLQELETSTARRLGEMEKQVATLAESTQSCSEQVLASNDQVKQLEDRMDEVAVAASEEANLCRSDLVAIEEDLSNKLQDLAEDIQNIQVGTSDLQAVVATRLSPLEDQTCEVLRRSAEMEVLLQGLGGRVEAAGDRHDATQAQVSALSSTVQTLGGRVAGCVGEAWVREELDRREDQDHQELAARVAALEQGSGAGKQGGGGQRAAAEETSAQEPLLTARIEALEGAVEGLGAGKQLAARVEALEQARAAAGVSAAAQEAEGAQLVARVEAVESLHLGQAAARIERQLGELQEEVKAVVEQAALGAKAASQVADLGDKVAACSASVANLDTSSLLALPERMSTVQSSVSALADRVATAASTAAVAALVNDSDTRREEATQDLLEGLEQKITNLGSGLRMLEAQQSGAVEAVAYVNALEQNVLDLRAEIKTLQASLQKHEADTATQLTGLHEVVADLSSKPPAETCVEDKNAAEDSVETASADSDEEQESVETEDGGDDELLKVATALAMKLGSDFDDVDEEDVDSFSEVDFTVPEAQPSKKVTFGGEYVKLYVKGSTIDPCVGEVSALAKMHDFACDEAEDCSESSEESSDIDSEDIFPRSLQLALPVAPPATNRVLTEDSDSEEESSDCDELADRGSSREAVVHLDDLHLMPDDSDSDSEELDLAGQPARSGSDDESSSE